MLKTHHSDEARLYAQLSKITDRVPELRGVATAPRSERQLEARLHTLRGLEFSLTYHYAEAGDEYRHAASLTPHDPVVRYFLGHPRYWQVVPDPYKPSN